MTGVWDLLPQIFLWTLWEDISSVPPVEVVWMLAFVIGWLVTAKEPHLSVY